MGKDILSVRDMQQDFEKIIDLAIDLKKERYRRYPEADNKTLAMIFEKPSTRTRVSFQVAMDQLGGHSIVLNPSDMQLGRGETIEDTARVLSSFVDVIAYRAFKHHNMVTLARNSTVPVINALDDIEHPVQMLADFMTIKEVKGKLSGLKLVYVGDGNNVTNSLLYACAILGINMIASTPQDFGPDPTIFMMAKEMAREKNAVLTISHDPANDMNGADVIYTDVWVSMGEEDRKERKERYFEGFQVNRQLIARARKDYMFLHCLPAHRGLEVSEEIIDGPNSYVFQQAENRLHSEKALLLWLLRNKNI